MLDNLCPQFVSEFRGRFSAGGSWWSIRNFTTSAGRCDRPDGRRSLVKAPGRPIDECIALAKEHGSGATLDDRFEHDLEQIIAERKPLDTSAWD
jgi:hypothetical protein